MFSSSEPRRRTLTLMTAESYLPADASDLAPTDVHRTNPLGRRSKLPAGMTNTNAKAMRRGPLDFIRPSPSNNFAQPNTTSMSLCLL
jgi:hypothetical protein